MLRTRAPLPSIPNQAACCWPICSPPGSRRTQGRNHRGGCPMNPRIAEHHHSRSAYVYLRQSTPGQVGAPSWPLRRRNCAPQWVLLRRKVLAAIRNAFVTRLLVSNRPFPMILSPLIRWSGHRGNQETKWCSVIHLLISHPASLRIVIVVVTSIPSIWVRSVPVMRNSSAERVGLAGFSRACWLALAPPTLLGRGSPHCYGINNVY
jgi:hypothetical protein